MPATVRRFLPGWVGLKRKRRKDVSRANFGMGATPYILNQFLNFIFYCHLRISYLIILIILAQKAPKPTCNSIIDVGFILDTSASMTEIFGKSKAVLRNLAATFFVGDNAARIGVVSFSFSSKLNIKLNDHNSIGSFSKAVNNISLMGYTTRLDKALRFTRQELFSIANGARTGVPRLVIVIIGSSHTRGAGAEDPRIIAKNLQLEGISIVVIAIGNGVEKSEMELIFGNSNLYFVPNIDRLLLENSKLRSVKKEICAKGNNTFV